MTQRCGGVEALAADLAIAIESIMHPMTDQTARSEAYMACEKFKDESPLCAQVGLYLASATTFSQHVRHFGLQLMEFTIKFKWNCISQEEKLFIKDHAIKMLNIGVGSAADRNLSHLKDALSRIIVEMIKREWPQHWADLLPELSQASSKGEAQTELVLLVFLRLVEDVALLQTIESNERRRDMYQALTSNMHDIFLFFLHLMEQNVLAFRDSRAHGNFEQANAHSRVVELVLLTLSSFVDWVNIQHIIASNGKLLTYLCILLNDKAFQCNAAECLAQITNRKGQIKDRKQLLMLYEAEPLQQICTVCKLPMDTTSTATIEQQHNFLKKLLQVLKGLVQQLVVLWGKEDGLPQRLTNFEIILECLMALIQHPSLSVAQGAALIWQMLLKHDGIAKDKAMDTYIPQLIQLLGPRIVKIGYPKIRCQPTNNTTEAYICLEHVSEDEFAVFYHRCRFDFLEIFRQATMVQPLVTYAYCERWLQERLRNASHESGNVTCCVLDPIYLDWEALVFISEGVLTRLLLRAERPITMQAGWRLLEECLAIQTINPLIYSIVLSCISVLFFFYSTLSSRATSNNNLGVNESNMLYRVFDKLFTALRFKPSNDVEKVQLRATENLRRHAAMLLVKLSHKFPRLLLPIFEQISVHVKWLLDEPDSQQLCRLVRTNLKETLVLIANHLCSFEQQTNFIYGILREKFNEWMAFSDAFKSPLDFMRFVGLDKAPMNAVANDPAMDNRERIMDALHVVLGIVKRSTWPENAESAQRGGFVVGYNDSGRPICRNPVTKHVVPLLPNILALVRILNELFKPEALAALSADYRNIYDLVEHDKKLLMGVCVVPFDPLDPTVKTQPTPFDKMQTYMTTLCEGCYHLLGTAGPSLGYDFYQLVGVADALTNSIFSCLDVIPDHRLRLIIRVYFKPFVYACPPAFNNSVLLPMFAHLAPLMCERLTRRWLYISSLYESGQLNDEIQDTQEALDDQLNRTLTREYLDVLKVALAGGQILKANEHATTGFPVRGDDDVAMETDDVKDISDLGAHLLRQELIGNYMLKTLLNAIVWNDGVCSMRAVNLAAPVMRFLTAQNLMDANKAVSAFTAVLQGMQMHGQQEANQSGLITLGVQFYELLRPKFPLLTDVLQRIPCVTIADIQKLDEKISLTPVKDNRVDRTKKDIFKKITEELVGRSINQLFRYEMQIANQAQNPTRPTDKSTQSL